MKTLPMPFYCGTRLMGAALLLIHTFGCTCPAPDSAAQRGFLEQTQFAASLIPNIKTANATDRTSKAVSIYRLQSEPLEFQRNSQKIFTVNLPEQPLLVRFYADLWQQGFERKPHITINGNGVGDLEMTWPSIAHRNYMTFLFDKGDKSGIKYSFNYQGWLKGACVISGTHLKPGINEIVLSVAMDQIKMKTLCMEALFRFDPYDTFYDFRDISSHLSPPMISDDNVRYFSHFQKRQFSD